MEWLNSTWSFVVVGRCAVALFECFLAIVVLSQGSGHVTVKVLQVVQHWTDGFNEISLKKKLRQSVKISCLNGFLGSQVSRYLTARKLLGGGVLGAAPLFKRDFIIALTCSTASKFFLNALDILLASASTAFDSPAESALSPPFLVVLQICMVLGRPW